MQEDSLTYFYSNDTIDKAELYLATTPVLSHPELKQEPISRQPEIFDWIFCIFLICFIFLSNFVGKRMQVLSSITTDLFSIKKRDRVFSASITKEWYSKLFLCFQACLLLAVFLYKYFTFYSATVLDSPVEMVLFVLLLTFILCVFFFLKWSMYYIVSLVFFDRLPTQILIGNFFSLLAFSGVFLFIPVVLYFYTNTPCNFFFFVILASLALFEVLIIYKSIVLFFYKRRLLLHLFLYLCAQEIIPLFFLWKIMVYVFNNFVEKSALWL